MSGTTPGAARVAAQWTYDAYGNVTSADHLHPHALLHCGHKGLFAERLDVGVADVETPGFAMAESPRLVPFARLVYHNRNRMYSPGIGRFVQADPNATAMSLLDAASYSGRVFGAIALAFSMEDRLGDGANLYQYLQSNPWTHSDPMGLSSDPFDMVDEIIAEHRASSAAFLNQLGQGAKAAAVIAATIASYLPFPIASAAGELALVGLGEQSPEEAAVGIAMGLIPGGKLAKHFKKLTGFVSKLASAAWSAAKQYVGRGVKFLYKLSPLGLAERAMKWAARKIAGCGCFARDTLVWTAVGLTAIGDLAPGDLVFTRDDTGEITLREVTAAIVTRDVPLVEVTIRSTDGTETTIETTDEHPFRVMREPEHDTNGSAWRRADGLRPGDLVVLVSGLAEVASVRFTSRTATVHNLTVEGTSSYFVGEDGVWVHNCKLVDHHWIPQASDIKTFVSKLGIDVEDFRQLVPESFHRAMHGNHLRPEDYLPRWRRFIESRPDASKDEVMQFLEHLKAYYEQSLVAARAAASGP